MRRRRTIRKKHVYQIDGKNYTSKALYDTHVKLKEAKKLGIIKSFVLENKKTAGSKYATFKPIIDDNKFDSLMEANYYIYLKTKEHMEQTVQDIVLQPEFILQESFTKNGKKFRPIVYIADFKYVDTKTKQERIVDVKGKETVDFKIKRKMFEHNFKEYTLEVLQFYEPTKTWENIDDLKKIKRSARKARSTTKTKTKQRK